MNCNRMEQILNKIKEYDRIMLFRHIRGDGDSVGSTKGLKEIIRLTWPEKEVYLIDDDMPEYLSFLGPDDLPVDDELYRDVLGIVLDTAAQDRISNPRYALCRELIKIDHHLPVEDYGNLAWVDVNRSSCCEMIAELYRTFSHELIMDSTAATYLYAGLVTDSGRFRYNSVSGDTMRAAATLLDIGVDTDTLFAHLYLESFDSLKFTSAVYERMKITEHGVAYLYINQAMQKEFDLSLEQAGACVKHMESIRGCLCWTVFLETGDPSRPIRARMRSRFVPINSIAEQYRGGGHAFACGATVYSTEEMEELLRITDAHVKAYKESHDGWL